MSREVVDIGGLEDAGPAPQGACPGTSFPGRAFVALHPCIEDFAANSATIVVHENNQCFLVQLPFFKLGQHAADIGVNVGDHSEIDGLVGFHFILIGKGIFRWAGERSMRGVERDIAKKRLGVLD